MQCYSLYGLICSPEFQRCADAAAFVNAKYSDMYNVMVNLEMPVDFHARRQRLAADGVAASDPATGDVATMEVLVVDEKRSTALSGPEFVKEVMASTNYRPPSLPDDHVDSFESRASRAYAQFLNDRGNRYCWMDVERGGVPLGRITYELFRKMVPHTCQNFWRLCRGDMGEAAVAVAEGEQEAVRLSYEGTRFFRILKDAWVMGGDVSAGHGGNGGFSCYGRYFPDECFAVPHDGPGVLGMCNDGPHSNASSFYITRKKMSWMNGKYVAFGRVIDGMDVVDAIHDTAVKHNQAPVEDIVIAACGVIGPAS